MNVEVADEKDFTMSTVTRQPAAGYRRFATAPLDAALGIEALDVDLRGVDEVGIELIRSILLENLLVLFRNQTLQPDDVVSLVRQFGVPVASARMHGRHVGERAGHELYRLPDELTMISNVIENGRELGALGDAEVIWHSDFSFKEMPTAIRMLLAAEVPPPEAGGNTYFANCYAAYDALSKAQKERVSGMTIKQTNIYDATMKLRPGAAPVADVREAPGPSHPIISTHPETGANLLFLGRRHGAYVNGLPLVESEELLDELWAHCVQDRFVYSHQWSSGDLVVWDNRATLHRRDSFDPAKRRVLYAAQVEGHRPIEAPDALLRPAHGRGGIQRRG